MFQKRSNWLRTFLVCSAVLLLFTVTAFGTEGETAEITSNMYACLLYTSDAADD